MWFLHSSIEKETPSHPRTPCRVSADLSRSPSNLHPQSTSLCSCVKKLLQWKLKSLPQTGNHFSHTASLFIYHLIPNTVTASLQLRIKTARKRIQDKQNNPLQYKLKRATAWPFYFSFAVFIVWHFFLPGFWHYFKDWFEIYLTSSDLQCCFLFYQNYA